MSALRLIETVEPPTVLGESFLVSIDAAVVILVLSPWMLLALLQSTTCWNGRSPHEPRPGFGPATRTGTTATWMR